MAKVKVFNINWVETDKLIQGESCFGNVLIYKDTCIAHIFGPTGIKKWYPNISINLNTKEKQLKELMKRINDYHCSRVKYIAGAWIVNE